MSDGKMWLLGGTVLVQSLQMYFCLKTTKLLENKALKKKSVSIMGSV